MNALVDQAARDAAADPRHSVLLRAPAGSGKTGVLLLRFLNCLACVERPEQVVAITFTRKAAAEIRERIVGALQAAVRHAPVDNAYEGQLRQAAADVLARDKALGWDLLRNNSRLRVYTIDSFCGNLSRTVPLLSGMAAIAPTENAQALYREAILSLLRDWEQKQLPKDVAAAFGRVLTYGRNQIEALAPELEKLLSQREQWLKPLLGTGRVDMAASLSSHLQHRIGALAASLAEVGFEAHYPHLVAASGTEDSLAWAAALPPLDDWGSTDLRNLMPLLGELAGACLTKKGEWTSRPSKKLPPGMFDWIKALRQADAHSETGLELLQVSKLPAELLTDATEQALDDLLQVVTQLLARLQLVFASRGECDFPEVAFRAIQALKSPDDNGGIIGDALLLEDRIQHILVDEMQDTSVNQMDLLEQLTANWEPDDGRSLFFCGDLLQSIYLFRGAVPDLFERLSAASSFGQRPLEQLQLQANFRTAVPVVERVNEFFDLLFADGSQPWVRAQAVRDEPGAVAVHGFTGDDPAALSDAEADCVVRIIRETLDDTDKEHRVAVLVRAKKHLDPIIERLQEHDIAFAAQDVGLISAAPAVRDLLFLIRLLLRPVDRVAWVGVLRAPWVGLCWEDIRRLAADPNGFSRTADATGLSDDGQARWQRLIHVLDAIDGQGFAVNLVLRVQALWYSLAAPACYGDCDSSNVQRVLSTLEQHCVGGVMEDADAFLAAVDRLPGSTATARVELMTIHKSKGLEFDTVILPQLGRKTPNTDKRLIEWQRLDDGAVIAPQPLPRAPDADTACYNYLRALRSEAETAEQLRLAYVAFTRARNRLHLVGSIRCKEDKEPKPASGSLLAALWPALEADFLPGTVVPSETRHGERHYRDVTAPRLALPVTPVLTPVWQAAAAPESELDAVARETRQLQLSTNIGDRAVGTVYHELMEALSHRVGSDDADELERELDGLSLNAITARLRHHLCPLDQLSAAAGRVWALAKNTMGHDEGRWLLKPHEQAASEQAFLQPAEGVLRRLIVDRLFVAGGSCWVVDYKTSQTQGDVDAFVAAERARYADKMQAYRTALGNTGMTLPVVTALYFPAHQRLETL